MAMEARVGEQQKGEARRAPDEHAPVGRGIGSELRRLQPGQDELIHRRARPVPRLHAGNRRRRQWLEGPELPVDLRHDRAIARDLRPLHQRGGVRRAEIDPAGYLRDCVVRQPRFPVGHVRFNRVRNHLHQSVLLRIPRNDRRAIRAALDQSLARRKVEVALQFSGTMALDAVSLEQRRHG